MYKCEICGKEVFKKISLKGYTCLCSKHMHQLIKHGHFLDSNPRTIKDLNKINIKKDIAEIELYDGITSNINGICIIDVEDVFKIKYHKWRKKSGHVITGSKSRGFIRDIGHFILDNKDFTKVIDHINGNPYDNRKSNLRLCKQSENTLNKYYMSLNTSGIIGVSKDTRKGRKKQWIAEIRINDKKCYLGSYLTIEEATYARYCGEIILFKEFRNTNSDSIKKEMFALIPIIRKQEIEKYISDRLHKKYNSV